MKTLTRLCIGVLGGAAVACGLTSVVSAQDAELVGTWNCTGSIEDAEMGMTMTLEYEHKYTSDGSYDRTSQVRLAIAAMQVELSFSIDEAGTWRRDGMNIGETPTAIEVDSDKEMPSEIEQLVLAQIEAEAELELGNETVTPISALTASTMTLDEGEFKTSCKKA